MPGILSNILVGLVILVLLVLVIRYMVKEKKKGHACIGCPYASSCSKKNHCVK